MMWLRQMAQLSTTMSQAQRATAFHCFLSASLRSVHGLHNVTYLLDLEPFLPVRITARSLALDLWRICHFHIRHGDRGVLISCGASTQRRLSRTPRAVQLGDRKGQSWKVVVAKCGSED